MSLPSPLVELDNISLHIDKRSILQDINLKVYPNQIISIVGPNGGGKTSLIKLLVGISQPNAGLIKRAPSVVIGYMPQQFKVDVTFPMTVKRFLTLGIKTTTLNQTMEEVGLKLSLLESPLYGLSGGELQRVLLARILLRKPQLLVLDEPAQGVDLIGQSEFYALIAKIRKLHKCGIVLVSHDLNIVMAQTDVVVCLNGHVCCQGHPDVVTHDPAFTALFGKVLQSLAFYQHQHDHHHDVSGKVICQGEDDHHV